jgi:hypothetical protein
MCADLGNNEIMEDIGSSSAMDNANFIPRETPANRKQEDALAARLNARWGVEAERMHTLYQLDFALKRDGEVKAWAECKCRTHLFGHYPTYMFSLKKMRACRDYHRNSHLKAFLIVEFNDGDYWVDTQDIKDFEVKIGGRTDRGAGADIEPCIYFNVKYFKKFK